ncbi:MAG: hypothetical protein LKG38_00025 [Atopobiaceae bacterium]|nr:hypothetical protein [Atopobiaceae bacterium]MCH4119874.1 hypothetical protein [Atopobiaceae bacterium]MCI1317716.1 hypothetical protein [Atopobiaceae bacterium]MCI1389155.1 hypothetical protein [Atopobiaceae bacterium]MCI1432834.1 hypothetical protein [Atopobiaceae bacterium]
MAGDITFFDVETPNRSNSKICSIGVVRTDAEGNVQYEDHFLVDPEQGFDSRNISIHGIAPSMVKGAPTFAELWKAGLFDVFDGSTLVAHNATFDLNVLEKTLAAYGFDEPEYPYVCTMRTAQRVLPGLPNYQLPTLSQRYGVALPKHHDALCDTRACEGVFWGLLSEFGKGAFDVSTFIPVSCFAPTYVASNRSKLMTDLYGILVGLSLDGTISPDELCALRKWAEDSKSVNDDPIIRSARSLIDGALEDDALEAREHAVLLNFARPFVTDGHNTQETVCFQQLLGVVKGISADGRITEPEARRLDDWVSQCNAVFSDGEFLAIERELDGVLADGVVAPEEEERLLALFDKIVHPMAAACEAVQYQGKRFVLTGNFTFGERSAVEEAIRQRGGEIAKGVSGKVSYVVVGNEGSEHYANGEYGSKVRKAMELQDKGKPIQIITETDLCL